MLTLVNEWKFLAGLGMFLFGLFMMEESIKRLSGRAFKVMIRRYTGSRLKGLATGILSTAILQSSSAVSLLVLAFMGAGLMTLVNAIAVIIGAKVGTTVTAIVVLLALPLILWLVHDFLDLASNAVLGVALFHTLFNVTGAVIFFPLISTMARRLEKLFPEKRTVLAKYILNTSPQVPEAALVALREEVLHQLSLSVHYIASRYRIDCALSLGVAGNRSLHPKGREVAPPPIGYFDLERLHAEIFAFYAKVQAQEVAEAETAQLEQIIRSSRSIMNSTKNLYEVLGEIEDIGNEDKLFLVDVYQGFRKRLEHLCLIVDSVTEHPDDAQTPEVLKSLFNSVEDADKAFIRSCSKEVAEGILKEHEVTRLLMVNRLFTQSSRMLVLSMQGLIHHRDDAPQPNPHDPVAEAT